MLPESTRRRDVFKPGWRFRDARTGLFVTRLFAFRWPQFTVRERAR
jgi:hypothetical protein